VLSCYPAHVRRGSRVESATVAHESFLAAALRAGSDCSASRRLENGVTRGFAVTSRSVGSR
jgi:hypothetical protein